MFKSVSEISGHLHKKNVQTSGIIFKLISKYTTLFCLGATCVISCDQVFGAAILCSTNTFKDEMQMYCWTHGTYIFKELLNGTIGINAINYGVGPDTIHTRSYTKVYQSYYQWIIPLLLFQALIFYIPKFVWNYLENGRLENILKEPVDRMFSNKWEEAARKRAVEFLKVMPASYHRSYAAKYYMCQTLNYITLIINMVLINSVLNNFWIGFYPSIQSLLVNDYESFQRNSSIYFPKQAKCDYIHVGPSGTLEKKDSLCLLPQNVINEKVFIVMYIWLLILFVLSIFSFFINNIFVISRYLRLRMVVKISNSEILLTDIIRITDNGDIGICFFIYLLNKNLNHIMMMEFLQKLTVRKSSLKSSTSCVNFEDWVKTRESL